MRETDSGSIVIVDDNSNNLRVLSGILQQAGYKVRPALGAEIALRAIQASPPDLILLDIRMPGIDGYEACRRLKDDDRLRDIPVIFISALSDTEDKLAAFASGGVDYVSKPFQAEEVLARVRTHVQLRRMQVNLGSLIDARTEELRNACDALAAREREFRALGENLPDNIVRYDLNGRMVYVNPALERTLGATAETMLGITVREFDSAGIYEAYAQSVDAVLATGEDREIEMDVVAAGPSGPLREVHQVRLVAERGDHGQVVGVLAIGRDITAMKMAECRLRESYDLLKELTSRRETAREEERKRIAREIHDELGQQLTALRLKVNVLNLQFGEAAPALREAFAGLLGMVDKTIQVARNVSTALRPAALNMGIVPALDWLADEFQSNTGIACKLGPMPHEPALDEDRAIALFRIAQEALTNVARHAQATRVSITLEVEDGCYVLEIADNGVGFDPGEARLRKFGLVGMRERMLSVGGEATIDSAPGRGTRVRVSIPIAKTGEAV